MRRFALLLVVVTACASPPAPPELYEDVPVDDGKSDGVGLAPLVAVSDYASAWEEHVTTGTLTGVAGGSLPAGAPVVAIRSLRFAGEAAWLLVDARTLDVVVATASEVAAHTREAGPGELATTRYVAALAGSETRAYDRLAAAALAPGKVRFAVTVDMCQSARAWEKAFFEGLVALGRRLGRPVPVGVAMTGRWAVAHPRELGKLAAWDRDGALEITWIDHSYDHPVKDKYGNYTFLTDRSVDFTQQILRLEVLLLGQRLVPSPLFRFPGLTHDAGRLAQLNQLSLFALDANAWLAKRQPIADGAVVLLHGNGNEPLGMDLWDDEMDDWEPELVAGRAQIVPIADVVR